MAADGSFLPVLASPLADVVGHGFFAPVSRNAVDDLIAAYDRDAAQIRQVATTAEVYFGKVLGYFFDGNLSGRDNRPTKTIVGELFEEGGALKALRATYWQRALQMTDVLDCMPQARRDEWNKSIREMETPEFDKETVYATLRDMLSSRERFFAERVDGIFRNLSGDHVTNSPAGFSQRMIIAHLVSSYGSTNHDRVGYINDLRCIIARFMGRGEPRWNASSRVVESARKDRRGEWITLDGGTLRLRAYKCGTAHLEVNPEMAWRLNAVLASLYPTAIPPEFRSKPKKKVKDFALFGQALPFAVLEVLGDCSEAVERYADDRGWQGRGRRSIPNTLTLPYGDHDKALVARVVSVLEAIGGVKQEGGFWAFDYDPRRIVREIVETGVIPDQKAHQFYPTPKTVAERVQAEAGIEAHHTILEPSAGLGGLLVGLSPDRVTCVEVASLHAKVLRAKGYKVAERDFIEWAGEQGGQFFDRIVMNPPFSQGRAQLHLDTARGLLATGGRLVAVLPESFRNKPAPTGWAYTYSEAIANEFADTSIAVVILTAQRVV